MRVLDRRIARQRIDADPSLHTIQLATLDRAAASLNCGLLYHLSPKEPLGDMVWRHAFARAATEVGYDPDDPEENDSAVRKGEAAEALAPFWVDRRGL